MHISAILVNDVADIIKNDMQIYKDYSIENFVSQNILEIKPMMFFLY